MDINDWTGSGSLPGAAQPRDLTAPGGNADAQIDAFISRRHRERVKAEPDPDEREELWKDSVRRYNARRKEENRLAWCDYFSRLAGTLRARAEEYDQRAQTLMEAQPKGAP